MEQGGKHQHLSPPELSNGNSQHLQPELSKSPEFSKFPSPLSPPPRWPARQFRRCVSRSPVTPEVRQAILSSFDFEKSYDEQPESAILKLEKLLGYERWPWLDDLDRRNTICDKVSMILHKFLWSHRYYWLTDTGIDGKSRLLISPKEGIEPLPLPEWLSTPYIVRVPHQDFTYKPETGEEICENPTITSGHAILDSDQRRPDMS
ncbi:uncharacterized protein P174DRAFT_450423 [Aspergillus novofumigatus IBT 16806]|uniref:Uncharacterized protein n=1 Tax=Aspergillus novofumigatus (strain IBT 16806) TaxID=1392255 RepID=A0A2I1CEQ4_ASPN1|nr:uncharacterized protein P174DRAFT_450423 [Aspergillus novofumigatus IBT 16806]PKX96117.1 hypothetical protein P174DRAFT_450423 [Aspergillus novofumigatus IBT 16806]